MEVEALAVGMLFNGEFKEWIGSVNRKANQKLMEVLFKEFKLNLHLGAIKRYLLLGQGEFIHTLMQVLQNELSKAAVSVYRHNLIGLLEGAIRASNVQYFSQEILSRLDVKLLEPSQGDTGWEVFSLDYRIEEPLNTVFNERAMLAYLRIFNFLWRVKRIEHMLGQIWCLHMKNFRIYARDERLRSMRKSFSVSHSLRNEMQHFIQNLYNYIMVEAVEGAWKELVEGLAKAENLDGVIRLHEEFQQKILESAFLSAKHEAIYKQLFTLFEIIFKFNFIQEILIGKAKEFVDRSKSRGVG